MKKVELLTRIQELSSILSSENAVSYLSESSVNEMAVALDKMTNDYLETYCSH